MTTKKERVVPDLTAEWEETKERVWDKIKKTEHTCKWCGHKPLAKAGPGWSGTNRLQMYQCSQCGHRWMNKEEPYIKKVQTPHVLVGPERHRKENKEVKGK